MVSVYALKITDYPMIRPVSYVRPDIANNVVKIQINNVKFVNLAVDYSLLKDSVCVQKQVINQMKKEFVVLVMPKDVKIAYLPTQITVLVAKTVDPSLMMVSVTVL